VPLTAYVYLVILYFIVSVVNNMALSYNISMPLHMIFKGVSRLLMPVSRLALWVSN
jgi:UDP-xylose/UDP-N-acetylglucosamine transporter B4